MFVSWKPWMAVVMGVLAGCGGVAKAPMSDMAPSPASASALQRVWMLAEWPGYHRERLQAARAQMDWRRLPQAGAHMGCNQLMFQVTVDPVAARLHIGPVAATRMYCIDYMDLELTFSGAIGSFTRYRLQGNELVLENEQGQSVRWVAADPD